jgi:hypothetical protein
VTRRVARTAQKRTRRGARWPPGGSPNPPRTRLPPRQRNGRAGRPLAGHLGTGATGQYLARGDVRQLLGPGLLDAPGSTTPPAALSDHQAGGAGRSGAGRAGTPRRGRALGLADDTMGTSPWFASIRGITTLPGTSSTSRVTNAGSPTTSPPDRYRHPLPGASLCMPWTAVTMSGSLATMVDSRSAQRSPRSPVIPEDPEKGECDEAGENRLRRWRLSVGQVCLPTPACSDLPRRVLDDGQLFERRRRVGNNGFGDR